VTQFVAGARHEVRITLRAGYYRWVPALAGGVRY
jgi:hypothetical protein